MKLWYLYVRDHSISMAHAMTDGHFALLDYMMEHKIVDEVEAIIDVYKARSEQRYVTPAGVVVKRRCGIEDLKPKKGDVVWIRGGWKCWLPWIHKVLDDKIWLIYYDSNTGHRTWMFWDVVLSDIIREQVIDKRKRLWYWYPKPISPVFTPMDLPIQYDICIGASRVFDKKGQWKMYRAVVEYEKLFGVKLKCAMPGCYCYGGIHTREMREDIWKHPNVHEIPLIPRPELAKLFNMSKVFTHMCGGGYGDRSPLEAGACGCSIMLTHTKRHASFVFSNSEIAWVPETVEDPVSLAKGLKPWIEKATPERRKLVAEYFKNHDSIETGSGPRMRNLFEFFRANPEANRDALKEISLGEIPQ